MDYQRSQLTKIQHSKLPFNCDYCGVSFEKYACWAKRTAHHYCGRACASAAKVIRIPKNCVVCDAEIFLTPTYYNRVATCSKECMRKKRVRNNTNLCSSPDYVTIVKRLRKNAVCKNCGTTKGPWIARGVTKWIEGGLAKANGDNAYLLCRVCHLKSVIPLSKQSLYMSDRVAYYTDQLKEKNT